MFLHFPVGIAPPPQQPEGKQRKEQRAGRGTWEESAVIYENASPQVVLWIGDRDTLKLDLFVVIRRRQIPLALIWLNEAAYTVVLSACIWY